MLMFNELLQKKGDIFVMLFMLCWMLTGAYLIF